MLLALVAAGLASAATPARAEAIIVAAVTPRAGLPQGDADITAAVASALAETAKSGGLLGRTIRLVTYEEDCSRAEAETIAGQIVARGASLVIGHVCSAAAIAAAPVYARNGIVMIAVGARNPRLTEPRAGPTIFRLAGRDDRFGAEVAALIAARFAGRRVAIVHDKSIQARTLADAADRELRAQGVIRVLREAYVAGERDYNKVIDALAAAEADVIIIPAQPVEAGIILAGLAQRNIQATVIGSEIMAVPEIEARAKLAGEGLILMLPWMPEVASATVEAATASGGAATDAAGSRRQQTAASPAALLARAGIGVWVNSVRRAQSLDATAISRVLESETVATAIGPVRFDLKGDALLPSFVPHSWVDGRWKALWGQARAP